MANLSDLASTAPTSEDAISAVERRKAELKKAAASTGEGLKKQAPTDEKTPVPAGSSFTAPPRLEGESMLEYRKRMEALDAAKK